MSRLFVWSGGAMFVASLALCAWWYLAALGTAGLPFAPSAVLFDTFVFALFASHHSVFARDRVKAAVSRAVTDDLVRPVYVWTASVLLIAVIGLWRPVGGELYRVTGWPALLCAGVQLAGIGLIARAVRTIDPLELAGIRRDAGRGALQVAGPYRWVRHPVYLGWIVSVFGAAHMTGDRLLFAATTTVYRAAAVPWEERALLKSFGEDYRRYRQRVRWRIVPYVY
jgi:methanethiol S-methyltransferase